MHEDVEERARKAAEAGELRAAVTLLLRVYGPELLRFLVVRLRDPEAATEVYAEFCADLWAGMDHFGWRCSARTWCYMLARHAASRHLEGHRRRAERDVPLSALGPLSELPANLRTQTELIFRTEIKNRFAELRDSLEAEDQMLLVLHVNQKLKWRQVAQILCFSEETPDETKLRTEEARLRKRFQLLKARLRQMAKDAGILDYPT